MSNDIKYMPINEEQYLEKNNSIQDEYFIETVDVDQSTTFNDCEVRIHFNPYLKAIECFMYDKNHENKVRKKVRSKVTIDDLEVEFLKEIDEFMISQGFINGYTIGISGTLLDMEDFQSLLNEYNCNYNRNIKLIFGKEVKSEDRMDELRKIRSQMANSKIDTLNDRRVIRAIDECINEKNQLVVCATMSTGKSSLINSFLATNLMPSKNEACTAKIVKVVNDRNLSCFTDAAGSLINEEKLTKINDDEEISGEVLLKGPIKSFYDIDNFEIIDTPGPNNSLNSDHKTVTYDFIKSDVKPLTIFLLDATKLLTTDDDDFFSVIAAERKNKGKINQERFIFVINKSDELNVRGRDSLDNIKENVIKKLAEYDIQNPRIHFVSARNALLARLLQEGAKLDYFDEDVLDLAIRRARRGDSIFYKMSDVSTSVNKEVEEKIKKATEEKDDLELVIATSGVYGLELSIKEFMGRYKKFRVINRVYNLCSRALENETILDDLKNRIDKNKEKSKFLNDTIESMRQKIGNPEKMYDFIKEVKKIKFGDTLTPIEKIINKEFDKFRIEINQLPVNEANGKKLVNVRAAEKCVKELQNKYIHLKANLESEFTSSVSRDVVMTIDNIMNKYKAYLSEVFQDIKVTNDSDVQKYFKNVGEDYLNLIKAAKVSEMVTETHIVRNPAKKGFMRRILFFWMDDYVTENKVKSVQGIELEKIKETLTMVRTDLYILYNTIQAERKKTETKCIEELTTQVKAATEAVLNEMDKLTQLANKQEKIDKNIEFCSTEFLNKKETINNLKTDVKRLVRVN